MAKDLQNISLFLNSNRVNAEDRSNNLLLFHNSKGGFIGKPEIKYCRETCDFGQGIYLAASFSRVSGFINNDKAVCYAVNVLLDKVKHYVFEDIYLFYVYCICNRTRCYDQLPNIIKEYVDYVDNYELVIGETLDGTKMMSVLFAFMDSQFDLAFTNKQLKLYALGLQYCIKSQVLLDTLKFNEVARCSLEYKVDSGLNDYRSILTQDIPQGITFSDLVEIVRSML